MASFEVFVYENNGLYDVCVGLPADKFRNLVATHIVVGPVSKISQILYWQFGPKQIDTWRDTAYGIRVRVRKTHSGGEFTQIYAELNWISSVIEMISYEPVTLTMEETVICS